MSQIRDTFNGLARTAYFQWWEDCYEDAGRPAVIQYDIESGDDGGTWYVVIDNHRPACTVHEGPAPSADLRLRLSGDDWLDIVAERTTVWSLFASRRISAEGDRSLIGVLDLLGLLGSPVTAQQVAAHQHDHWIARTPYFVLPRVLSAGLINHDKWLYFVAQGDLRATISRVTWRVWADTRAARHAHTLRSILLPLWWRDRLLRTLPAAPVYWLPMALTGLFGALVAFVLAPWWLFLLMVTVMGLFVSAVGYAVTSIHNLRERAAESLTRLACDDSEFFRFAVECKLIQIDHTPWGSK